MSTTPEFTTRGFANMPPITCTYGSVVKVYESSSAESPRIWLSVDDSHWRSCVAGEEPEAVAHLSLEAAEQLRDQLDWLIANHYQRRDPRSGDASTHHLGGPDPEGRASS